MDPLSISSAVIALVTAAVQCSTSLYKTLQSYQNHSRAVRQLNEQLVALNGVLESLRSIIADDDSVFTALKLPLLRCGQACKEFETLLIDCTTHSGGSRASFRDWAKLKYMGDDINGFTAMLAGYKSTIAIALGDANLRSTAVTLRVLDEYKELIRQTTLDLEEHLSNIDNKLQMLVPASSVAVASEEGDMQAIQKERESTKKCLEICNQVASHIEEMSRQIQSVGASPTATPSVKTDVPRPPTLARDIAISTFEDCDNKLAEANSRLQKHLQEISGRLDAKLLQEPQGSGFEQWSDLRRLREELDSVKQCLSVCNDASDHASHARVHVFEEISMEDDGQQVFVSTLGDLLKVKGVSAGSKSAQWFGSMTDASLQQLSRDRNQTHAPLGRDQGEFEGRYGAGHKLRSMSVKPEADI